MEVSLSKNKFITGRIGWLGLSCVGGGVLVLALWRDLGTDGFSVTAGTNVARVSVEVTHGTNHTFYYRGQARWMWNNMCKRFGWRLLADVERQHSWTYESADMLWVICHHRGDPLDPRLFQALEVTAEGRRRMRGTTGGICDKKRGVSVSHWALIGGMEKHRGSVIYVKYGTRELAKIEVR